MYPPSQTHYTYQFTPSTSNSFFGPKSSKNSQITNCQKLPEVTQDFLKDKKPLRERFVERLGKLSNVLSGIANVLLESVVSTLMLLGGGLFMIGSVCYYALRLVIDILLSILIQVGILLLTVSSPLWTPVYCFLNREED